MYIPTDHAVVSAEDIQERGFLRVSHAAIAGDNAISGIFDNFLGCYVLLERQNLEDRVHYLHQTATQSSGNGSPAAAIITKISDDFALLDRSHCQLHLQLCAQIHTVSY